MKCRRLRLPSTTRGTHRRSPPLRRWWGGPGELLLCQLTVEALDQAEDHLLFAAMTESGQRLEEDAAVRFFRCGRLRSRNCLLAGRIQRSNNW